MQPILTNDRVVCP